VAKRVVEIIGSLEKAESKDGKKGRAGSRGGTYY